MLGQFAIASLTLIFAYGLCYYTPIGQDVQRGGWIGPDAYTRIMWVEQLATHGGWEDVRLLRFNAPDGMPIHWTRPMDLVILAIAYPCAWLTGLPMAEGIAAAGRVVSPLLAVATVLVYAAILRRLGAGSATWLLPLILFMQPVLVLQFAWGRPDHHSLQLLVFALLVAAFVFGHSGQGRLWGAVAALAVTLSVWISPEGLLPAAFTFGFLAVMALGTADSRWRPFAFGLAATMPALAVMAWLIERPLGDIWLFDIQRYSMAQLLFLWLGAGGVALASWLGEWRRLDLRKAALLLGYGTIALTVVGYTGLLKFSHHDFLDPRIRSVVFENNNEFRPLWSEAFTTGHNLAYLFAALVILAFLALCWRRRAFTGRHGAGLGLLAVVTLFFSSMALFVAVRWSGYVQLLGVLIIALAMHHILVSAWGGVQRIGAVVVLAMMPFFAMLAGASAPAPAQANAAAKPPTDRCDWSHAGSLPAVAERVRQAGDRQPIMLAPIFDSPKLAWFARAAIIAGPYADVASIVDTEQAFRSTGFDALGEVARRRGIDYVIVCRFDEREYRDLTADAAYKRLQRRSDLPPWLEPLTPAASDAHGLLAYAVGQHRLAQPEAR